MTGKQFFYLLWTLGFILFFVLIGTISTNDRVYSGTEIRFTRSNINLVVGGENVSVSLDSREPFVLFQGNKTISGKMLVLSSGERFVAEEKIPSGQWTVKAQNVSYAFTSEGQMTVRAIRTDSGDIWFALALLSFLVCAFVIAIVALG